MSYTIDAAIEAGLCGAGLVRANSYQVADHVRGGRLAVVLEAFDVGVGHEVVADAALAGPGSGQGGYPGGAGA